MIDVKPSENVNLYNLDFYFNELIDLYNKKKMPNKILLSGKKGVGKSTLAYHLTNYILSENEEFKYNNDRFYINDVIDIFTKLIFSKKKKKQVYNICSNKPISVKMILKKLDNLYGKPKIINKKKLSIEVLKTHGSNSEIKKIVKLKKFTDIDDGIKNLVLWAKRYLDKI